VGLTNLPCKKENCREASKKFNRILRRRPRPKLDCGAKERRRRRRRKNFGLNSTPWSSTSPQVLPKRKEALLRRT
jgi:hypothetical protein